jgi:nitroreductase
MDVHHAIANRRAYRALQKFEINQNILNSLANAASLAPSCFNKQPWRFVFVYEEKTLNKMFTALSPSNKLWATRASLIIVVFSKKEDDCISKGGKIEREYYLFDVGMATAFMILQASELELVAHPIAGYNPNEVHEILSIPSSYNIINLLIVGKKDPDVSHLSEPQRKIELTRPVRKPLNKIVYHNRYMEK